MIGTVISVVALGVSLFVLVDSRRLDRRDLLLKLREQLIAPDRQTGRRCCISWPASRWSHGEMISST